MIIGIDANEANLTTTRVGVNQYAFSLIHALRDLSSNHKFVIYLKNQPLADLPMENKSWKYRVIPFPKLWTQTRLPLDLYTNKPRPNVFFSATHYSPRWCPVPTVVSIMDLGFLNTPEQFTSKDFNQLRNWTSYSVRKATKVIAISENTKKDIIRIYCKAPEDITVTRLAYDKEIFKPVKNPALTYSIKDKYNIRKPFFLFLSSLKPSKNVQGLIKAFHLGQRSTISNFSLVISGKKGWLYDEIFDLVKSLNLDDKVIFTGEKAFRQA